ncbi:MAG: histidine kinase [Muribaculaceae bacterium]|nr:histidine kinase [Muribaculaceae bacterium]
MSYNRYYHSAIVLTLSLILFYLPTIIFQVETSGEMWEWDFLGIIMATFYSTSFLLNYFWLVPQLLQGRKRRVSLFILVNLAMVLITMLVIPLWIESHHCPLHSPGRTTPDMTLGQMLMHYAGFSLRDGIMVVLAAALGYAIRIGREKESIITREFELEAEERKIELQNLKAQLNPHFLFNSLNNIYALIGFAPERAQEALHTLSKMLRFMIYDASESVPLKKEAEFIGEFVELMRLRKGEPCRMRYHFSESLPGSARISPLLYVTLAENAFKHSASNGRDYYIDITFSTKSGKNSDREWVVFKVENTYSEKEKEDIDGKRAGGVGIANVRRQLGLLYPGQYIFEITASPGVYTALLAIETSALQKKNEKKMELDCDSVDEKGL